MALNYEKPEWFDIPRISPALEVEHEGEMFSFDFFNTTIFYFAEPYSQFNHLFHNHNGSWVYMFNCPSMMDTLHEQGYPSHFAEWPSEDDVEAFIQMELEDIDHEPRS
jgi:hypothetical protein